MFKDKQVTIIGAGHVGTVLGRLLMRKGWKLRQVFSRQISHARQLSVELGGAFTDNIKTIDGEADLYLLCVTDDALPAVAAQLLSGNKLVVHTAGAFSKEILHTASTQYGVLWPMKMIRKTMQELGPVSVIIDGSSKDTIDRIREIAALITDQITIADDQQRLKMHMLAAVTSNFPNHLYHLAADYCAAESIDFSIFYPLILETARSLERAHPAQLQAGPAFRGDTLTLEKHEQLLQNYPQLLALYEAITQSLLDKNGHKSLK